MLDSDDLFHTLHTVRDFIRWGASRMNQAELFFGHGTEEAIDESATLVLHALHLPPDLHSEYFSSALTLAEKRAVIDLLQRRIQDRIPAAYLMNRAWFMGLPFYVDPRVLIPRSPLAELIENCFSPWLAEGEAVTHILDLGTGSGCIGIACAHAFPNAQVDLVDISDAALEVARRNIHEHGLEDRVQVYHSDLFSNLDGRCYQLIVSNPPYVGRAEMADLPSEYRHEPPLALESGEQGLDAVREILQRAPEYLSPQGLLAVEVGNTWRTVTDEFPDAPLIWPELERGGVGVFVTTA
ncbi:MAG: 50S ribosomal protein L3 N(5)-glutamine methyltransferase, partial [Rhodobacteraceae bacterium]|nr:50S ribosomal protein L3 N(5)-glutamine methyltransferase [Paracoccaceae bacterium]